MLDENQRLHATTPSVFSLPISSSTEPTLTPAWRLAGSTTFSVVQARRGVDAVIGRRLLRERLRFGLHDVGQARIARLVEAQIGGDHRRAALSFTVSSPPSTSRVTSTLSPATSTLEANVPCGQPSRAASIWPVWFESSSIACLPRMTRPGCSSSRDLGEQLGDGERLDLVVGLDQDRAVGAHRQRGAQRLLRLGRADRDRDDLGRDALLLQADRLLDRDLVERVHAHLDVGEIDARCRRP